MRCAAVLRGKEEKMKKRVIGNSGIEASVISLGTWAMGGDEQWGAVDDDSSLKAIFEAVDRGINLIDTAPAYGFGHSEELVGKVLKEFPREACDRDEMRRVVEDR